MCCYRWDGSETLQTIISSLCAAARRSAQGEKLPASETSVSKSFAPEAEGPERLKCPVSFFPSEVKLHTITCNVFDPLGYR